MPWFSMKSYPLGCEALIGLAQFFFADFQVIFVNGDFKQTRQYRCSIRTDNGYVLHCKSFLQGRNGKKLEEIFRKIADGTLRFSCDFPK